MTRRRDDRAPPRPGDRRKGKLDRAQNLDDEDRALWEHMAQGFEPIRNAKPRVSRTANDDEPRVSGRVVRRDGEPQSIAVTKANRTQPQSREAKPLLRPAPAESKAPPLQRFEKKRLRRIASGRREIEARLDLHGSRQAEAHGMLRAFLFKAQSNGLSTVLVVTGKGGASGKSSSHRDLSDPFGREERGVLRRMVPLWLEEPDLRALVASFTFAAVQHGGEGALYIHLRRKGVVGR